MISGSLVELRELAGNPSGLGEGTGSLVVLAGWQLGFPATLGTSSHILDTLGMKSLDHVMTADSKNWYHNI